MNELTWTVPETLDGSRLDKAVVELAQGLSRARIKKAIESTSLRVNGRYRAKGEKVRQGDVITLEAGQANAPDAPAVPTPDAPLQVRFESAEVLLVEKPAGQPTAALREGEVGTLANALVGHYPELAGVGYGPREPGLVNRLDTDTSGLVLVARTAASFDRLRAALKEERILKQYLLVCASEGLGDKGSIEIPIANHPKDQRRVYACAHPRDVMRYAPRPARTTFSVERRKGPWALVRVEVMRALRHQIRVHFAAIGHPLVGDVLYGGPSSPELSRHALHAARVTLRSASGAAEFDVESPLPPDIASLVEE